MAAKLQADDANVVHLPTRRGKGSGTKGGAKPVNRLKPAAGTTAAEKPKRKPRGQKAQEAPPAASTETLVQPEAAATPAPADHNRPPTEAEIRAARQEELIAFTARHQAIDNKIEAHKLIGDELNTTRKELRAAISNRGFLLDLFDEGYGRLRLRTKRIDLQQREELRDLMWEAWGLPHGSQAELDLRTPEAAKPALHWRSVGYQDGILGLPSDAQKAGVPPENLQDYMAGFSDAMALNARGLKRLQTEPDEPSAAPLIPPAGDGRPDWSGWARDHGDWTEEQLAEFDAWYETVPLGVTPEFDHVGAAAYWQVCVAETEDVERGAAEALAEAGSDPAPADEAAAVRAETGGDDFEATPEELAQQSGRKAIQERREAGDTESESDSF